MPIADYILRSNVLSDKPKKIKFYGNRFGTVWNLLCASSGRVARALRAAAAGGPARARGLAGVGPGGPEQVTPQGRRHSFRPFAGRSTDIRINVLQFTPCDVYIWFELRVEIIRRRFASALLLRLFGNNIPGHTTRAPPFGFGLAANGIQFHHDATSNLDKT